MAAKYLTFAEAATALDVSYITIRNWVKRGLLDEVDKSEMSLGKGMPRLVTAASVEKLARERAEKGEK